MAGLLRNRHALAAAAVSTPPRWLEAARLMAAPPAIVGASIVGVGAAIV